jgi:hypothetical protein
MKERVMKMLMCRLLVFFAVLATVTDGYATQSSCAKFNSRDTCQILNTSLRPPPPDPKQNATQNRNCCFGCDRCNGYPAPTPSGCAACAVR